MNSKTLIIMLNNAGDVAMASSVFNMALKNNDDTYFLIDESHKDIFFHSRVLLYPRKEIQQYFNETNKFPIHKIKEFVKKLKKYEFNKIVNLYQGNESAILSKLLVDDTNSIKGKYLDYDAIYKIDDLKSKYLYSVPFEREHNYYHVIDIFKRIYDDKIKGFYPIKFYYKSTILDFDLPEKYIIIQPSSAWESKIYNRFDEVIEILLKKGFNIVLTGVKKDRHIIDPIIEKFNLPNIIDLVGKTSKKELIEVIKNASYLLSGDSFAIHIAASFNKPIVALFSSTDFIETAPYCKNAIILKSKNDKFDFGSFEKTKKDAINDIEPELIAKIISNEDYEPSEYKTYIFSTFWDSKNDKLNFRALNSGESLIPSKKQKKIYDIFIDNDSNQIDNIENEYITTMLNLRENLILFKIAIKEQNHTKVEELNSKISVIEQQIEDFPKDLQLFVRYYRFSVNSLPKFDFINGYINALDSFILKINSYLSSK